MAQTTLAEPLAGATALVAQGEALIRVENESMMRVAIERPRDEIKVLEGALRELELVPEEAALAYYSIPYQERSDGRQKTVHVEGPSIKAAMALARRWGNCTPTVRLLSEDAGCWNLAGVFVDYETSFKIERPYQQLKTLKRRDGSVQILSGKMLEAAFQSGVSKAMRNATLAGLPAFLVKRYYSRAKEIVAASMKVADIVRAFSALKVTQEQLERHLEQPADKWTPEDVATLRGVWSAIKDGALTVEDAFARESAPALDPAVTVTPESLFGGTVSAEEGVDPGDRPATPPEPAPAPTGEVSRSLLLSILAQRRDKVPAPVFDNALRHRRLTLEGLGRADIAVLEELVKDLDAVIARRR
jgi:hypothetical protein